MPRSTYNVSPNPVTGTYDAYSLDRPTFNSISLSSPTGGATTYVAQYSPTGRLYWATKITGTTSSPAPSSNATDTSGNVYVVISWPNGNALIYNLNGTVATTTSGTLSGVVKYNKFGVFQWFLSTGTLNNPIITFAPNGDFGVCGGFTTATYQVLNLNGSVFTTFAKLAFDAAVIRYNSLGVVQWATQCSGTTVLGNPISSTFDAFNNNVVSLIFRGTLTLFNANGTLGASLTSAPGGSVSTTCIVRYTPTGTVQLTFKLDTANNVTNIATDGIGNIYAVSTAPTASILYNADGSVFRTITTSAPASFQGICMKYTFGGTGVWVVQVNGTVGNTITLPITADAVGNVYFPLYSTTLNNFFTYTNNDGSTFAGPTNATYYFATAKISPTGSVVWVNNVYVNSSNNNTANGTALNSTLGVYQAATVRSGAVAFANPNGVVGATLGGTNNIAGNLAKYDANGFVLWAARQNSAGASMDARNLSVGVEGITIAGTYVNSAGGTIYSAGL